MKLSSIRKKYNYSWGKKREEKFPDYVRNRLLVNFFHKGEEVLDLAAGDGQVSWFLIGLGCKVIAMDVSLEAARRAKERGIKVIIGDVEKRFPFKNDSFDVVFWGDNIEHLFDPAFTLGEIKRVLKKNGRLVLSCPNMAYWRYRALYLLRGMVPKTEYSPWKPWEWEHLRFFNLDVLKNFLEEGGFELRRVLGTSNSVTDRFLCQLSPAIFGMILLVEGEKK